MEEWVGARWHRFIWRAADVSFPKATVRLEDVQRAVQMLFRAGGGDPLVRVAPATAQKIGGPRNWLQKVAGQGERAALSTLDEQTLALPPSIAVFADTALNRDLYLWLAAQGACHVATSAGWLADNLSATQRALQRFPGLRARYARLVNAHLAQRPPAARLQGTARALEQAVQAALQASIADGGESAVSAPPLPSGGAQPAAVAPVWLWLQALAPDPNAANFIAESDDSTAARQPKDNESHVKQDNKRRRAQRTEDTTSKDGLVMFFRAESILSWSEFVRVNRTGDDEDNQDYSQVADDMEQLHLAHRKPGETLAARIKFDLDLPSASADDLPVGEGVPLPEWDEKSARLVPNRCRAQRLRHRPPPDDGAQAPSTDGAAAMAQRLKRTSRQVRRRFEALRAAPRWQHGLADGEELNLDAWVRHQVDRRDARQPHGESPPIFSRRVRSERSLATLMLADLSLSTDAYATPQARVIDLVRDSLFVFGNALDGVGDPFEMLGFSSVRRAVRIHELKRFSEPWNDAARERVAAIKPGFYTRMGAAIRYGVQRLDERPERQRLLLILSDGKPNDLDHYEGRHGLEDTRHAVFEARQAGLVPFCVTIDEQAHQYLPRLFGAQGFALVHRPDQLARALTQVYIRLTAAVR
ncbi:nitric oxide reductase activation protein NorD [Ottowia testudinis]|uniref:VWA domain-containing protein n=1 Tax=Ottowia testudinis TaxID=2816950 RepID=A0A975CKX9_9BURK|nr:VWA domain-containing protein [Ottowia testudinis]QTD46976.1 VWA domain-containing protein [Ottowia testudinis]